jgi:hypothetical protein
MLACPVLSILTDLLIGPGLVAMAPAWSHEPDRTAVSLTGLP